MRLLAFSDLHLDAPFQRAGAELAAVRRSALRDALSHMVTLAQRLQVDAVFCAGDLYEHERFTPDTSRLLQRSFAELGSVPVLVAPGNHDWYGPSSIYATGSWTPNVHIFTDARLQPHEVAPGVVVWGAAHLAPSGTAGFLDGFQTHGTALHLGLFHGSELGGWGREDEAGKVQHAPFRAADIAATGLSHVVVGHHHRPVDGDLHTYPGSPVPLAFGHDAGGGAVEMEFDDAGALVRREWHRVTELAVHDLSLDLEGCTDSGDLERRVDAMVAGRRGVARLTLHGELSSSLTIEPAVLQTRRAELQELVVRIGAVTAGYDLATIGSESTVRGQFVRDVLDSDLASAEQQRIIITGLRALEGRDDLEVA